MNIEPLEPRIAPAATFTYIDLDGDVATITTSKGTNADLAEANGVLTFSAPDPGEPDVPRQLQKIDLSVSNAAAAAFEGTDLTVKVTRKAPGGDGAVHVGFIDAREIIAGGPDVNIELGAVTIGGDLGQIEGGLGERNLAGELFGGVKSLSVHSLGLFGLATQGGTGDLVSIITGPLGALKVRGDVREAGISVRAGTPEDGFIGPVTTGGSLLGGDGPDTGVISASGDIGAVKIGGDLRGGDSAPGGGETGASGAIRAGGKLGSVTIGGSVLKGRNLLDGIITANDSVGPIKIGRDLSGLLFFSVNVEVKSVAVGGSVHGDITGKVLRAVTVAGDVTADIGAGKLASVTIGGSVLGGSASGLKVKVAGDVTGSISVGDQGSVTIGGSVLGGSITGDRELRAVKIGHDLRGGSISVGVEMPGDPFVRKISSITIGGSFIGVGTTGRIFSAGEIGAVKIGGDMIGDGDGSAIIRTIQTLSPDVTSHIGSVKIGGSLIGGAGVGSARIEVGERVGGATASGNLGPVTIGGSVRGDAQETGFIRATGTIGAVKIGGSLEGGAGQDSGKIFTTQALGAVKIGRDLRGGSGGRSGLIDGGTIAGLKIGGSLVGGPAPLSGAIISVGDIGPVKIARDLQGGSVSGTGGFDASGYIRGDRIASIAIGGSILAGLDTSTGGGLTNNATIRAADDIGPITVKGSIAGTSTGDGNAFPIIGARGQETLAPGATTDLAIKSLTVGGRVDRALILAGFTTADSPDFGSNANASIGPVRVGGDWIAASLVAGVNDTNSNGFGNDDLRIAGATLVARIASITIKGTVAGTFVGVDHFGFTAAQIGAFKSLGFTAKLTPQTDATIPLSLVTANVAIREV